MHALDALTQYAFARRPDRDIPSDVYLLHDPHTVTVFDKFPKGEQENLASCAPPTSLHSKVSLSRTAQDPVRRWISYGGIGCGHTVRFKLVDRINKFRGTSGDISQRSCISACTALNHLVCYLAPHIAHASTDIP